MNKAGFESRLRKQGYENIGQREMAADVVNEAHTHDFDAQVLVVDGEITIVRDGIAHTFRKGDTCELPAGTKHAERVGPEGVRYIAGRRQPAATG
jgi:quercetin dioxygenase-like cupin family protein